MRLTTDSNLRRCNSFAGLECSAQAAQSTANEYVKKTTQLDPISTPSLLGDAEDDPEAINTTGPEETHSVTVSCYSELAHDDALAHEIGTNAHEYLEECFYTEVSVLDREKFDALPEIIKSDFTIKGHLAKGNFSDIFEVVCNGGRLDAKCAKTSNDFPGGKLRAKMSNSTPVGRNRKRSTRDTILSLSGSFNSRTLEKRSHFGDPRLVLAMKCLRPQIRSDAEMFTIGSEDLVHETAMLANLNHEHIIKVHGRASGPLSDAFGLNDGYFILLDKLDETLHDRIDGWREANGVVRGPNVTQMQVAYYIADAVLYLHSKKIVFRDLKPDNVGFDSMGVTKLFDFGFAIVLPEKDEGNPEGVMFDRCGTLRYMAPEVGLSLGYGMESDVYSFGVFLWEICALVKPFSSITLVDDFERDVFKGGERPEIGNHWPKSVMKLIRSCWATRPSNRPTISDVKSSLSLVMSSMVSKKKTAIKSLRSKMTRGFPDIGW